MANSACATGSHLYNSEEYLFLLSFSVFSSCGPELGLHADYQEREANLCTQESGLYLWCQSIMLQQLNLPAKVTVFNEISGAKPTALFQEQEIIVKNPQEDIKIML